MNKKSGYYVLLSDVFDSRKISGRKGFEKKLLKTMEWVSDNYASMFAIPMKQWKGIDEVAAVIKDPSDIYQVIKHINQSIFPEKMRFVLAKGSVNLKRGVTDINLLDGEAFHMASNLMKELKKEGLIFKSSDSEGQNDDAALSNQVNLVSLLQSAWTAKQMNIYAMYCATENQQIIANKMKISQQSVSKTLTAINASMVMDMERRITDWIQNMYSK